MSLTQNLSQGGSTSQKILRVKGTLGRVGMGSEQPVPGSLPVSSPPVFSFSPKNLQYLRYPESTLKDHDFRMSDSTWSQKEARQRAGRGSHNRIGICQSAECKERTKGKGWDSHGRERGMDTLLGVDTCRLHFPGSHNLPLCFLL